MDRRSKLTSMRRKLRHSAEDQALELRALRADNARLRAALEEVIAALDPAGAAPEGAAATGSGEALDVARRALEDHP